MVLVGSKKLEHWQDCLILITIHGLWMGQGDLDWYLQYMKGLVFKQSLLWGIPAVMVGSATGAFVGYLIYRFLKKGPFSSPLNLSRKKSHSKNF